MERRLAIYLRTYRLRWGLTQPELARLLGIKSATHVSRLERGKRKPTAATILACVVIFGAEEVDVFPAIASEIKEDVLRRGYELYLDLQGKPSKAIKLKLDLLEDMLRRAAPGPNEQKI